MSDQDRIRATFQDLNNDQAVNLVYTAHDTAGSVLTAYWPLLVAVSVTNLVEVRQDSSFVGPSVGPGDSGDYPTCGDMATLEFTAADGSKQPVSWPGPKATIFKPDHVTVDPANSDVADLIVWCLAHATTKTGSALVEYNRGWRWNLSA